MKNLMAKLKGMNYKEFFIEQGEKIALVGMGLFVFLCLLSSSWFGYGKAPSELAQKAAQSRDSLLRSAWPEEKQKQFLPSTYYQRAVALAEGQSATALAYTAGSFSFKIYASKQKIREPSKYVAPESPVAEAGRVVLAMAPEGSRDGTPSDGDLPAASAPVEEEIDPDLQINSKSGAGGTGRNPGGSPATRDPLAGRGGDGTMTGPMGDGTLGTPERVGLARRYALVKYVWPLDQQIKLFDSAMHYEKAGESAPEIEVVDYEIERQKAVAGTDPWTGPWEPLDIENTIRILESVSDFAIDTVSPFVIDPVMTCPLPERVMGVWGARAGHPKLKEYELSAKQQEAERQENEKALLAFREKNGKDAEPQRGGFSVLQLNMRGIRMTTGPTTGPGRGGPLMTETAPYGQNRTYGMPGVPAAPSYSGMGSQSASSNLLMNKVLLFRYFDFDVEPGAAYRYKVRLILRNPNFDKPLDQVSDASVVQGETRPTEWSVPTAPVVIAPDTNIYMTGAEHSGRNKTGASFSVLQWSPEFGSHILAQLTNLAGQFIGGKAKIPVLDLVHGTYEEEKEVALHAEQVLIDTYLSPRIVVADHADLNLPAKATSRPEDVGIIDRSLVANEFGDLKGFDPLSQRDEADRVKVFVNNQNKNYQETAPAAAGGGGATGTGIDYDPLAAKSKKKKKGADDPMDPMATGAAKKKNPLRRGKTPM